MVEKIVEKFYRDLPQLETSRLSLRKVTISDAADILIYASDDEVTKFLRWQSHQTLIETENYIKGVLSEYQEGQDGPWIIELKKSKKVIGHIHLMDICIQHSKAQVGFVLSRAYWNQGIVTEALNAVLEYSLSYLGLNRIEGLCISENQAAIRVLKKVGMKKKGDFREYIYQKGKFRDCSQYSILRREFFKK